MTVRTVALAAILVFGSGTGSASGQQDVTRPAAPLGAALEAANWLESVAVRAVDGSVRWPTVPAEGTGGSDEIYSGTAGVVLFLLELHRIEGEAARLELATAGGRSLVAAVEALHAESDPGLYTGAAGIGFALRVLAERTGEEEFRAASQKVLEHLRQTAIRGEHNGHASVRWNPANDVIGGSAGIGLYLLAEHQASPDPKLLELAVAAGDGLLAVAEPAGEDGAGLKWQMEAGFAREMPNYSHGTAGVCDFLMQLHLVCRKAGGEAAGDGRFLKAARRGADYLAALSQRSAHGLLPHHFPDGEELYYLGWCHGPAGAVQLFERLVDAGETEYRPVAQRLVAGLAAFRLPARSGGFWNNVSLCCGNAGLIAFLDQREEAGAKSLAQALYDDLVSRATTVGLPGGRAGRFWTQSEHRVRPELLQAQTGLMQGAAGIGLALLHVHEGRDSPDRLKIPGLLF